MKKIYIFMFVASIFACNITPKRQMISVKYPSTKKVDTVDTYFGTKVSDPYRWLEDDMSEETKAWVDSQNKVTFGYLEQIPFREKIKERLTKIWDYPKSYAPFKKGGIYFRYKNDGLQNQNVIYMIESMEPFSEKMIFDPNKLSDDGTIALTDFEVSDDSKYFAYGISRGGSDWNEIFIRDLVTGEQLKDHIQWLKFSGISWYKNGFFYSRYPKPKEGEELKGQNKNMKIYYHKIGTLQENDVIVHENPEIPNRSFYANVTKDKKYLIIYATESTTGNMLFYKDLDKKGNKLEKVVEDFDNDYSLIHHEDGKLMVLTNYNAPKYKLISIDVNEYKRESWKDIIPESEGVLKSVSVIGGKIFATYFVDVHDIIKVFDFSGKYLYEVNLPTIGSVSEFDGEKEDEFSFFSFTSYTFPYTVYRYNVKDNTYNLFSKHEIDFNPEDFETKLEFCQSKDGTKIPVYIIHKKGIRLNGDNPTMIYGYGGFNVTYPPRFSVSNMIWLENGGVYVNAHIRGGGEYGEKWHEAGTKLNKQNVFDDFIAVSEYMIEKKYTSPKKLAILGGSNGGLLVGAVINQRPDLYAVAFPAVGVMDMLRYHKFTIGKFWATDFGTSDDNEEMFKYIYKYSPLHSMKAGVNYPSVLVTTADHDDRVVPAHSFKYIAQLQDTYKGENPVLIRIETKAGHGAGKPTSMIIEEQTDKWSFAFFNMGIEPYKE